MINLESRNLIDYFALCGLDVKSGLESEPTDSYGKLFSQSELTMQKKVENLVLKIEF